MLFELAGQLEASVQGPVKQNLVRQLIMTLAALSRTLQGQNNPTSYPTEPGPDVSAFGPDYVPVAGKSPRWAGLLAELTAAGARAAPMVAVVDRDADFRTAMCRVLEAEGLTVAAFATCDLFLRAQTSGGPACLIIDSSLPGMSGLQLLRTLGDQGQSGFRTGDFSVFRELSRHFGQHVFGLRFIAHGEQSADQPTPGLRLLRVFLQGGGE